MDLDKIKVNQKAVEEGVWFVIDGETELKIASIGNDRYNERLEALSAGYRVQIQRNTLDRKTQMSLIKKAAVGTLLLDWKGLKVKGKKVEYSKEKALEYMTDPQHKEFSDLVIDLASEKQAFRQEEIESDGKKSQISSGGTKNTESTEQS